MQPSTPPQFGQRLDGMSFDESGEQLKRLAAIGLHGFRVPVCDRRYCIKVPSLTFLGEFFPLWSAGEVSAVLAAYYHLPIEQPRRVNDTPVRQARRRGQLELIEGGR